MVLVSRGVQESVVINKLSALLKENFCFTGAIDAGELELRKCRDSLRIINLGVFPKGQHIETR